MSVNLTTTSLRAEAIEKEWRTLGFEDGAPPHVHPAVIQADKRIYAAQRCGHCGRRGHHVKPMHRGREYRLLLTCRHCVAGSEG